MYPKFHLRPLLLFLFLAPFGLQAQLHYPELTLTSGHTFTHVEIIGASPTHYYFTHDTDKGVTLGVSKELFPWDSHQKDTIDKELQLQYLISLIQEDNTQAPPSINTLKDQLNVHYPKLTQSPSWEALLAFIEQQHSIEPQNRNPSQIESQIFTHYMDICLEKQLRPQKLAEMLQQLNLAPFYYPLFGSLKEHFSRWEHTSALYFAE